MNLFGSNPKNFNAYRRGDFDLETGTGRRPSRTRASKFYPLKTIRSTLNHIHYYFKMRPVVVFAISLTFGVSVLLFLSVYENKYQKVDGMGKAVLTSDSYPLPNLKNLVMVAGHSVLMNNGCEKIGNENSWFLETYQRHPGQASTFVAHVQEGVNIAAKDESTLLLFSGGETRKDAGPRSEAQSYWTVADSSDWFGNEKEVRSRALTEEHARDSFENLLFSLCRFRELTGVYPDNVTVVGYDFKEERFSKMHRSAIRFPESRFFYVGTPASESAKEGALKGEAMVRAQFKDDPYGCKGSLRRKKLRRDPFHRSVPYPNGCPEIRGLFTYCGSDPYPGSLPWTS